MNTVMGDGFVDFQRLGDEQPCCKTLACEDRQTKLFNHKPPVGTGTGVEPKGGKMEKPNSELFGSWVVYSHILKRKMRCVETENKYRVKFRNEFKFWKKFEFPGSGIFIGTRTLKNGNREFDCEEGYTFVPTEYITAALICPSPSQNPVYVPMEAFQPVETPLTTGMKGGKMKRSTDNPKSTCRSPTKQG